MKITTARRIAQVFFLALFLWLGVIATVGAGWWQWRGWPVAWFLQLDPLVALGTVLSTHSLHPGLAWALATIAVTILFGRVFCGFVCPFGAIHQFVGWIGRRVRRVKDQMAANHYRPEQRIKYYILVAMLCAAAGNSLAFLVRATRESALTAAGVATLAAVALLWLTLRKIIPTARSAAVIGVSLLVVWTALVLTLTPDHVIVNTLQIGLLDPLPLLHRSVNLVLLPAADAGFEALFPSGRLHTGAGLIGGLFLAFVLLNLLVPRFFCRVLCPLGALLGVIGRGTLWTIGKTGSKCSECTLCDVDCEGACNPMGPIRVSECLMCMNCLDNCPSARPLAYLPRPSTGGEITGHGLSRRGFVASVAVGAAAVPLARLTGSAGRAWPAGLIRPPGSVAEEEFLARCVKCSLCMRVCPTNVLQPSGFAHGWEALWTPVLDNRIGTSGCQLACVACGHACPTGAIRPLSLEKRHGTGAFASAGPVRIGLAFVDHGRCLPWSMERPCIVCEENCPVTPKAIYVSEVDQTVRGGVLTVTQADGTRIWVQGAAPLPPDRYGSGDYTCRLPGAESGIPIVSNTVNSLILDHAPQGDDSPAPGTRIEVQVRLQRPVVDPERCIGCGVCEHECPLSGLRAIRVTAENESRGSGRSLLPESL